MLRANAVFFSYLYLLHYCYCCYILDIGSSTNDMSLRLIALMISFDFFRKSTNDASMTDSLCDYLEYTLEREKLKS